MNQYILSTFNMARCNNILLFEIMRDIPITFDSKYYRKFYPRRAILCDNDEKKQIWKITGSWGNNKFDTRLF
jgi:hypothetical protein